MYKQHFHCNKCDKIFDFQGDLSMAKANFYKHKKSHQEIREDEDAIEVDEETWKEKRPQYAHMSSRGKTCDKMVTEEEMEIYDTIEEIWPDYPTKEDFFFNEDEY